MRNIFIIGFLLFSVSGFAQMRSAVSAGVVQVAENNALFQGKGAWRSTAAGDTVTLKNIPDSVGKTIYKLGTLDSGYVTGTDYWGDKAFAERYVNMTGSNMTVVGVMALFGGHVNPASANNVTFKIWDQGSNVAVTATQYYNGYPNNVLTAHNVSLTQLGIGATTDTLKTFMFDSGAVVGSSFFAGYSINYNFSSLNGDLIGLMNSLNGTGLPATTYSLEMHVSDIGDTVLDTVHNVQNATMWADNTWHDNLTDNDGLKTNLAIYPIVVMGFKTGVAGIKRNSFTFFGSYPNPAENSLNIRLSLEKNAGVTVQVMDLSGRVLNTITNNNLSAGEHIIPVNTSQLSPGEYLYLVRTTDGDGIAGKFTKIP